MKSIPTALQTHLEQESTTLALCWRIVKRDSTLVLCTDHDVDIVVPSGSFAGTYKAASNVTPSNFQNSNDMSVDNVEVVGALSDGTLRLDISSADIESGNLDFAAAVCFFLNWADPSMGQVVMSSGFFGQVTYDSTYGYKVELRSLQQLLQTNIIQAYSDKCDVLHFGDARCKVNVAALTRTATVTAVTNDREFSVSIGGAFPTAQWFNGKLTGLTGDNTGFLRQVGSLAAFNQGAGTATVVLRVSMPELVQVGDTFSWAPDCDRLPLATCKGVYNNLVNNRAYGLLIPGIDQLLAGPAGMVGTGP